MNGRLWSNADLFLTCNAKKPIPGACAARLQWRRYVACSSVETGGPKRYRTLMLLSW